jgi:hypothetical protein
MFRDHFYAWRASHSAKTLVEYDNSIAELPEQDRDCAAALWGVKSVADILVIIAAFHHLDRYREQTKHGATICI